MLKNDVVVVLDVDGVLTDGTFYSTDQGKFIKKFGPDDWDLLRELMKYVEVHFVTADSKGFSIVKKRIENEMKFNLSLVKNYPPDLRWKWIEEKYYNKKIIYIGDGAYDWFCLEKADIGIAPSDALRHVRARANWVIDRKGANRFVAEACIEIMNYLNIGDTWNIGVNNEQT